MNEVRLIATEQIAPLLGNNENNQREQLLRKVLLPNLVYLRGGNSMRVGQDGWYAANARIDNQSPVEGELFPIPTQCQTWHNLEVDKHDGLLFRFFAKRAWLYLTPPKCQCRLEFIVPFFVVPEALDALRVWVADVPMTLTRGEPDGLGRSRLQADVSRELFAYMQIAERIRLDFTCPVVGVPALLYLTSSDERRLSCAVSFPRFVEI